MTLTRTTNPAASVAAPTRISLPRRGLGRRATEHPRPLHMRALVLLAGLLAMVVFPASVLGDSRDLPLPRKVAYCAVVAEVRITGVRLQRGPGDKFEDLVCECAVVQAFKLPSPTNRLTLRLSFAAPATRYEQQKALIFAVKDEGHYTPYGGKAGLILEDETYNDRYSRKRLQYAELIRDVKAIVEANKPIPPTPR